MYSVFSRIVAGDIPSYKIAEDDKYYAFLDISPMKEGHTLVIPKVEIDYIFDLDDELLAGLAVFARKVAIAIKKAIPCERVGMMAIGMEVPHAHIHLIPIDKESDMLLSNTRLTFTQTEFKEIAEKIKAQL
ncbi:HIT family protein [Dysgonomonas sp. 25]|uniref:HIT family protein n=1 Tax=Dysgonomonas sp. 25 TaxID=2302933 RepID=UPI0013D85CE8|nr:HIT family protein [Dysgonomonas sp. 25]NDV68879.1 HIT family protein [Dysgonomonas sp. 25]